MHKTTHHTIKTRIETTEVKTSENKNKQINQRNKKQKQKLANQTMDFDISSVSGNKTTSSNSQWITDDDRMDPPNSDEQKSENAQSLTPEKIKEQLVGFVYVPREQWPNIPKGTYVKYISVDGKYHNGSYVKSISTQTIGQNITGISGDELGKKPYFMLESKRFGKSDTEGYVSFPIYFNHIKMLYKQVTVSSSIEFNLIRKELSQLTETVNALQAQIKALSDENIAIRALLEKHESEFNKRPKNNKNGQQ